MGHHERRASLARYRRETSGVLVTYLVPPDDPALNSVPLLRRAASWWLGELSTRVRHGIVCSVWLVSRRDVGALLLSHPEVMPRAATVAGVCLECWRADLPREALEWAALSSLKALRPAYTFHPVFFPSVSAGLGTPH
jgi:hypothetical protein